MLDGEVKAAEGRIAVLKSEDDYLATSRKLEEIVQRFGRLAPGKKARAELDRFAKDKQIRTEIRTSRRLESILKKYNKPSMLRKLKAQLQLLIKNYGETRAGKRAAEMVKKMRG